MKRSLLLFGVTLLTTLFLQGQSKQRHDSFQSGEWLRYRLHYGFLNASYATLSVKDTVYNGLPAYHAIGEGRTTGFASIFFKVEDIYQSIFSVSPIRPIHFRRDIDEGGYTKDISIDFNYEKENARITNNKTDSTFVIPIHRKIQDILSATYALRETFDKQKVAIGDEVALDMLFDDDGIYDFKLLYLGEESVKTIFGTVKCLAFRPLVKSGRIFREKESLTLWVSDDSNRVPIRIQADLRFGSIKADLDGFKGLKHPFMVQTK
ncbi:MAG: hypothetical protein RLZZ242_536 [Bacteroidota bacterium]|jgi:hypothetical protein